jgi:hypothetical protein
MAAPEIDHRRLAQLLIKRHGDETPRMIARLAAEMAAAGNPRGSARWLAILGVVRKLMRDRRPNNGE